MAALPFALTLNRVTNGLTRPFFGGVSDRIGRKILIAFSLEALTVLPDAERARQRAVVHADVGRRVLRLREVFSLFHRR